MRILTNTTKIRNLLSKYVEVDYVETRRLKELIEVGRNGDYDIIYFARYVPPLIDTVRIPELRSKVIIGMHLPIMIEHVNRPHHVIHNVLMPMQVRMYLRNRGVIIHVLNRDDEKYLMRHDYGRVIYAPLATNTELFKPGDKSSTFTLVYSSRASWQKGTDLAVRAMKALAERLRDKIRIIIIAYGPLVKLYSSLNGLSNVSVISYQPLNDFVKILSQSHALLFTSRYESFALLPLDALSAGNLVVSFNVRGFIRDYMLNDSKLGRFIVDFGDVNELISRVMELINLWYSNENEYLNLINYARSFAEGFSTNIIARIYLNLFTQVLSS